MTVTSLTVSLGAWTLEFTAWGMVAPGLHSSALESLRSCMKYSLVHFLGPSLSLGHFLSSKSATDFISIIFAGKANSSTKGEVISQH